MKTHAVRFVFLFLSLILISFIFVFPKENNFLSDLEGKNLQIFFSNNFENENFTLKQNGIGSKICCTISDFLKLEKDYDYLGISFETEKDLNSILKILNGKIISTQNIENKKIIYAFTNKFEKFVVFNNKKCNIEIVLEQNHNLVGMPLLLGSY